MRMLSPYDVAEITGLPYHKALLLINAARCKAREAELLAVRAFENKEGSPDRPDLLQALNRLSSFLYLIMLELKE